MCPNTQTKLRPAPATVSRPPIAILGVPFDNVTMPEAVVLVEQMVQSRLPHYLVTANVDFLVQAREDVELHRILAEAHLVLCDGTPLVWASRWLGNGLPERVAGADLVPLLMRVAAEKGYRVFLLGASPESAQRAVAKLRMKYPSLIIAGRYSPPFSSLFEMDHEEIKRRIADARPDILLVAFGCPKQEKWIWMHYRGLAVPVCVGIGATIDFLAGQVKRAPAWMHRIGAEWVFRLLQEPRRLFRRYLKDLWVFGRAIAPQLWQLQFRSRKGPVVFFAARSGANEFSEVNRKQLEPNSNSSIAYQVANAPARLDAATLSEEPGFVEPILADGRNCLLLLSAVTFIDSTGVGSLIKLRKKLRGAGRHLILICPSRNVQRALSLMHLENHFSQAQDLEAAKRLLAAGGNGLPQGSDGEPVSKPGPVQWHGEVTAANVDAVWEHTRKSLTETPAAGGWTIDLAKVSFIDSSGLGLMIRTKKLAQQQQRALSFTGMQPAVRNVLRLARLENFLFCE